MTINPMLGRASRIAAGEGYQTPDIASPVIGAIEGVSQAFEDNLTGKALSGDQDALAKLARTNPQAAAQIQARDRRSAIENEKLQLADDERSNAFYQELETQVGSLDSFELASQFIDNQRAQNPLFNRYVAEDEEFDQDDFTLARARFTAMQAAQRGGASAKSYQPQLAKNEDNETVMIGASHNPATDSWTLSEMKLPPGVELAKETPEEKRAEELTQLEKTEEIKGKSAVDVAAKKQSMAMGKSTFERLQPLDASIKNLDRGIAALNAGAGTGKVEGLFPSFRTASIELDQIRKEMGLDVVGATTFGALSKGELDLAIDVALPSGLNENELLVWMQEKKVAQTKLRDALEELATGLSEGKTIKEMIADRKKSRAEQSATEEASIESLLEKY